nr:hypothetical protein HK105_007430 [Polyrhizophydium stewartii]
MGNAASSAALLPAERVYALCAAFGLSVAEVEYCHRHYRALRFDAPHARRRGRGQPTDAAEAPAGPPAITDLLEADWLRARVFQTLFAVDDASAAVVSKTTLEAYLRALARWKNAGLPGRLALVFDVLDFDNDGWLTEADLTFKTGDRVCVRNSPLGYAGVLRFLGETEFREGVWAGIELDEPKGKNNGTVQGVQYFATEPKRGVFVDFPALQLESHFLAAHDILARIAAEPADRQPPANQIQAFGPRGVKVVWVSKEVFCARIAQEKWFAERIMQSQGAVAEARK